MRKKGNVSITLLVVGIFAICSLAIVTFMISSTKVSNSFEGVEIMKEMNSEINQYLFYVSQGISKEKARANFDVRTNEFGDEVFFLEKKGTRWSWSVSNNFGEEYVAFSVEWVLD